MLRAVAPHSLCLLLSLAACAAFADQPDTPGMPAAAENVITATYRCQSQTIIARYDNSNPDAPTARLEYRGRTFDMYNVRAASGARYATEQPVTRQGPAMVDQGRRCDAQRNADGSHSARACRDRGLHGQARGLVGLAQP